VAAVQVLVGECGSAVASPQRHRPAIPGKLQGHGCGTLSEAVQVRVGRYCSRELQILVLLRYPTPSSIDVVARLAFPSPVTELFFCRYNF
jgi:hypothetical protein